MTTNVNRKAKEFRSQDSSPENADSENLEGDSSRTSGSSSRSRSSRRSSRSGASRRSSSSSTKSTSPKAVAASDTGEETLGIPAVHALFWLIVLIALAPSMLGYLRRLWGDSIYHWLPLACLTLGSVVVLLRWDRNLRIPSSYGSISALACAATCGCVLAFFHWTWFAFPCFLMATASFALSNTDRSAKPLTSSCWFVIALLSLPLGMMDQVLLFSHELIRTLSINLLKWQAIPHVDLIASIGFPSGRLYVEDQLQSWLSLPLFFSLAMLYSSVFKRSILVTGCNMALSYVTFILFHVGLVTLVGAFDISLRPCWHWWQATLSLGALSALFFVSAERGFRCLLAPISDEIGGSQQINPIVAAWNYLQGFDAYRSQARKRNQSLSLSRSLPIAFILSGILLLSQVFVVPPSLASATATQPAVSREKFKDILSTESIVDYRQVTRVVLPEQGVVSDVWTTYLPSRTTQFSLLYEPMPRGNLAHLYTNSGWRQENRQEDAKGDAARAVALTKSGMHGRLMWAYSTHAGELLPASTDLQSIDQPLITIQCMAAVLEEPSKEAEDQIQQEFVKFSAAVAQKLRPKNQLAD